MNASQLKSAVERGPGVTGFIVRIATVHSSIWKKERDREGEFVNYFDSHTCPIVFRQTVQDKRFFSIERNDFGLFGVLLQRGSDIFFLNQTFS